MRFWGHRSCKSITRWKFTAMTLTSHCKAGDVLSKCPSYALFLHQNLRIKQVRTNGTVHNLINRGNQGATINPRDSYLENYSLSIIGIHCIYSVQLRSHLVLSFALFAFMVSELKKRKKRMVACTRTETEYRSFAHRDSSYQRSYYIFHLITILV